MDKRLDDVLYDALKPANEPDSELNRRILDRRLNNNMRKFNARKTAVAAAIAILVAAGGVSAYAASQNFSLLSILNGESKEVKKNAEKLYVKDVSQEQGVNSQQSQWANFKIQEAICDKNKVRVQVAATPAEPDKYLLISQDISPEDSVSNLFMDGLEGEQSIADYAKSLGKECVRAGIGISGSEAPSYSIENHMEEDGTLLFNVEFENKEKNKNLDYVCETYVCPIKGGEVQDELKDSINFTLKDNTKLQVVKYLPVSKEKVSGTNLIVDEVTFEKSDLEMVCNVKYHYAGKDQNWNSTTDGDICFFMLDSKGKIIQSGEGGSTDLGDGKSCVQSWYYSLSELPDTITFQAKDVMEKTIYGKVDVKAAK